MIFNTTTKCLEMYMGKVNNVDRWTCVNANNNGGDNGSGGGGNGVATASDKIEVIPSLIYQSTSVQGKINNGTNKLIIKIPYTGGSGAYNRVISPSVVTAPGQGGDINNLALEVQPGNFNGSRHFTATVNVTGADGEYLVKQLGPGEVENIATIPVTVGQTTFTVYLKAVGGIPDRRFGQRTRDYRSGSINVANEEEHNFIYMPVLGPDGRTWLNNNLGAEYARVDSPFFSPTTQAGGNSNDPDVIKNDWKAFGSTYQQGRDTGDGHELMTWNRSINGGRKYSNSTVFYSNHMYNVANSTQYTAPRDYATNRL